MPWLGMSGFYSHLLCNGSCVWKCLSFSQLLRRVPGAGHVSTGSTALGHWSPQVVLCTPGATVMCLEDFLQGSSVHRPPTNYNKGGTTRPWIWGKAWNIRESVLSSISEHLMAFLDADQGSWAPCPVTLDPRSGGENLIDRNGTRSVNILCNKSENLPYQWDFCPQYPGLTRMQNPSISRSTACCKL